MGGTRASLLMLRMFWTLTTDNLLPTDNRGVTEYRTGPDPGKTKLDLVLCCQKDNKMSHKSRHIAGRDNKSLPGHRPVPKWGAAAAPGCWLLQGV